MTVPVKDLGPTWDKVHREKNLQNIYMKNKWITVLGNSGRQLKFLNQYQTDIKVGSLIIPVVVDSGCARTMIQEGMLEPHMEEEVKEVSMACMHGASYMYPWQ